MNVYRIEGQEYVADSAEQAYAEHMVGWRVAQFKDGFVPAVPVLVATVPKDVTVHVPGVRSAGVFSGIADLVIETPKPEPEPEPDFWDCDLHSEELFHTSLGDAVAAHLEGMSPDQWPRLLTVYPFRRKEVSPKQIEDLAEGILEALLERMDVDMELGDPNEATAPTKAMKYVAKDFVAEVLEDYQVWHCAPIPNQEQVIDVVEWIRSEAPEMLDEEGSAAVRQLLKQDTRVREKHALMEDDFEERLQQLQTFLSEGIGMTDWEEKFVQDMASVTNPTKAQQDKVIELWEQYEPLWHTLNKDD